MFSKHFILNEQTLAIIEKFGEQMPNMNGYEAARRIRDMGRNTGKEALYGRGKRNDTTGNYKRKKNRRHCARP